MKTIITEVLICGSGPAGIACAFTLGKAGIETTVIDRKAYDNIGDKVCGDALSVDLTKIAIDMVDLPDPKNRGMRDEIERFVLKSQKEKLVIVENSLTIDRLEYGQYLLEETAKFQSVNIIAECKVIDTIVENNTVKGTVCKIGNDKVEIHAKIVVDATGTFGIVRSKLPDHMCEYFPRKLRNDELLVAYREILRTREPHPFYNEIHIYNDEVLRDVMPAYFWIFSRGKYEVNIGLGYSKTKKADIKKLNAIIRDKYFDDFEILKAKGDTITSRLPLPSLVHNGFIAVGDAGALVDILSGEGHGPALLSGIHAARQIVQSDGVYTIDKLWAYNEWIWSGFGKKHVIGKSIIHQLENYGFDAIDWLLKIKFISSGDIENKLDSSINISKLKIMRLLTRPGYALQFFRTMRYIRRIEKHIDRYPSYDRIDSFNIWRDKLENLFENGY